MKIHEILGAKKRNGFGGEISAAREIRVKCAEGVSRGVPVTAVHIGPQHWARTKSNLIERVSRLRGEAPCTNRIISEAPPLEVSLPVVIQTVRWRAEGSYTHGMAKLGCRAAIVRRVLRRKPQVVEIDHASRKYRRRNCEIAPPRGLLGIGMIFEESRTVVLDWLQREHIPTDMRGLRNPAHSVKAELYIQAFVVVEEASRSKYDFLATQPQTTAMSATDVRTYLEKGLVDGPRILIRARSRTTRSPRHIVELEFREQPEIAPDMEIEMRHHAAQDVTVMVLRYGAQHPVVVVLILRAIFQPERDIPLRIVR